MRDQQIAIRATQMHEINLLLRDYMNKDCKMYLLIMYTFNLLNDWLK